MRLKFWSVVVSIWLASVVEHHCNIGRPILAAQYWQANIGRPNTLRHFTPTFALPMCEIKDATGCRWIDLKSTRFWDGHTTSHRGGQTEWSFGDPPPCDFAQKVEESMVSFSMFKQPVLLGTSNPVPWLHDQCFTFGFHWSSRSYLSSQCFSTVSCRHHERIRDFEGKHAKKVYKGKRVSPVRCHASLR